VPLHEPPPAEADAAAVGVELPRLPAVLFLLLQPDRTIAPMALTASTVVRTFFCTEVPPTNRPNRRADVCRAC